MGASPISTDGAEGNPEGAYAHLLTYAALLQNPELARFYTTVLQHGPVTVEELKDRLDMPHSTAYKYVGELEEMDVLDRDESETPARVTVEPVRLVLDTQAGQVGATPTFIATIGAQAEREGVELFVERHGVAKLGAALHYALRIRAGELTQRTAATRLGVHAVEAMTVFEALQEVIDSAAAFDPYLTLE
jgi:hypothetical protein